MASAILGGYKALVRHILNGHYPGKELRATSSTLSATDTKRAANFNAGPGALPAAVLERIREELLDYRGNRNVGDGDEPPVGGVRGDYRARGANLRKLMDIPEEYGVIFVRWRGGSAQFTMAPMNLCLPGSRWTLHTGMWTGKSHLRNEKGHALPPGGFNRRGQVHAGTAVEEIQLAECSPYVYMCTNNTIEGRSGCASETGEEALATTCRPTSCRGSRERAAIWADFCRGTSNT